MDIVFSGTCSCLIYFWYISLSLSWTFFIYEYKISVKNNHLLYNYYLWATCFDSLESPSGPTKNRPKVIWNPKCLQNVV